jgi:GNAT superfamily N-acetyltransferase
MTREGVRIRELVPDDWRTFRDLRLAALEESPDAFASTSARERAFSEEVWRDRLSASATKTSFVAECDAELAGLVHVQLDAERPERAWLMAMWVSPRARRRHVGRTLVDAVRAWARARGARELVLQVIAGNSAAEALYHSTGFVASGELEPLRPGSPMLVRTMALSLL